MLIIENSTTFSHEIQQELEARPGDYFGFTAWELVLLAISNPSGTFIVTGVIRACFVVNLSTLRPLLHPVLRVVDCRVLLIFN